MSVSLVILLILIAFFLSVLAGLFSAIEAAYSVLSRSDIENLIQQNERKSDDLTKILNTAPAHLTAISFLRIVAAAMAMVIITLAFFGSMQDKFLAAIITAAAIFVFSFFIVALGPKSYGLKYASSIVLATAKTVKSLRFILGPIPKVLNRLTLRSQSGIQESSEREKSEQLLSLVDRAAEQDLLEEEEQDIIHSVVEFGDTLVSEVMVSRTEMVTIEHTMTIAEALEELLRSRHSRVPVKSQATDEIIGVVYLRDLAGLVYRRPAEAKTRHVTSVMKDPLFVPELQRADDLMRQMQREANHLAITVDEHGGIAGLVTLEDLIEELVGDIHDEHDREVSEIEAEGAGFIIDARTELDKLSELFEVDLEDEAATTVAGLLAKYLGRLPEPDDETVVSGVLFKVLDVNRKKQRLNTVYAIRQENLDSPAGN